MKVLGLITEYNPLHNGHIYHLKKSVELSGADCVVCVMSGNFIQRGEPALINKWARAKAALLSGVDLVIELPVVFAMSSAESFAFGAVKILDSLGVVNSICFGSEHGSTEALENIAGLLNREPPSYQAALKEFLATGASYPAAREQALLRHFKEAGKLDFDLAQVIGSSNNILGIEYIKALKKLKSPITPLTIKRVSNSYNETGFTGSISSATAVRRHISENPDDPFSASLTLALPQASLEVVNEEIRHGRGPVFSNCFESLLLSAIRKLTTAQIAEYPYVSEGLENRIKSAAGNCGSYEELMEAIGTKRYTRTRIQRSLFSILNNITTADFNTFSKTGPTYIRVLGLNGKGQELLSMARKKASLPVMVKTARYKHSQDAGIRRLLELESLSTDLYVLGYTNPAFRKAGQDFTQNIIRVEECPQ